MKTHCVPIIPSFVVLTLLTSTAIAGEVTFPPLDTPYDQCAFLATHNAFANPDDGYYTVYSNQPDSITDQLNYGVRVINLDLWLIRQKPVLACYIWEAYTYDQYDDANNHLDTTPGSRFETSDPLQVVAGHGLDWDIVELLHVGCAAWRTLEYHLDEIADWLDANPNNVVTVVFENKIPYDPSIDINYIQKTINNSRLASHLFRNDGPNPTIPAPGGRTGGWNVDRYGYPTLRQLISSGKNAVLYPHYLPRAAPGDTWKLEVQTVFGNPCLPDNDLDGSWIDPRGESRPLDDFTRPLCSVVHVPDLPAFADFAGPGNINDVRMLRRKWADIRLRYNRLPNHIWIDYYDLGYTGSLFGPSGPALFVNELNEIWQDQPAVSAVGSVTPTPSIHGWNNTDVNVALSGVGSGIQAIISRTWTNDSRTLTNDSPLKPRSLDTNHFLLQKEGMTTVSFNAVGPLGKKSSLQLVDVYIDKTSPTVIGTLDRPPDSSNGWYGSNVVARFACSDALSGVDTCPADVIVSTEGANQSVTGQSMDRALNVGSATITNINIDKTGPVISATPSHPELWPPNGKRRSVLISGTITDAGSGVDPATTTFKVTDEYGELQPSGPITVGTNGKISFVVQLEAKRLGTDLDGRSYKICMNAKDNVGHPSQSLLTVVVPHDQRGKGKGGNEEVTEVNPVTPEPAPVVTSEPAPVVEPGPAPVVSPGPVTAVAPRSPKDRTPPKRK